MSSARRKHWGWGREDQQQSPEQLRAAAPVIAQQLQIGLDGVEDPVPLEALELPAPRVAVPAVLAEICRDDVHARASHALGKSYADVVRGFRGDLRHPPDFVALPRGEEDVERVLEWCSSERVAAVPYGGGTSVVGGVTPDVGPGYNGAISLDLGALDRVLEVDEVSRAACIQAGALGPALEDQLRGHSLTLRHFPQSFEFSSLGGWIATRAGGHFATLWTHIEDLVESVRAITPAGSWESRRLPGSGAGVSPDRMLAGSEGTLGVITSAWVRVQPRPVHRRSAGVRFDGFLRGAECVRALAQSGLHPANCRLLDPGEAALTMAGDGTQRAARARVRVRRTIPSTRGWSARSRSAPSTAVATSEGRSGDGDAVSSWREAFLGAPYLRDTFVAMGVLAETFESSITWERLPAFHEQVIAAAQEAVRRECGEGRVFCRFTHVYPDGPAPYFTVIAPARRGAGARAVGGDQARRLRRRARRRAARSPTTTPSGATTGRGTTASVPSRSQPRCGRRKRRWTPPG